MHDHRARAGGARLRPFDGKIVLIDYGTSILDRGNRWRETLSRIVDGKDRVAPQFAVSMVSPIRDG